MAVSLDDVPDAEQFRGERAPVSSEVWLLKGLAYSHPGWLVLHEGRLRLYPVGLSGQPREEAAFDLAVADLAVEIPPHNGKTGMKVHAGDETYRLSFLPPASAAGSVVDTARSPFQFLHARRLCDGWQAALVGHDGGAGGVLEILRTDAVTPPSAHDAPGHAAPR